MEINLRDAFFKAFGYETDAFGPKFHVNPVQGDKALKRTEYGKYASSPYYAKDAVGREYYMPIEIQVGTDTIPLTSMTYAEALGVTDSSGAYSGRWNLPFPVISVELNKRFIDTDMTERNGMVSELINVQGFKVMVRGFLINKSANEFPEDDYTTLIRLVKLRIPVRVNNPMIDVLFVEPDSAISGSGEREVTIRNLHFPERPGVKHVKPYQLELWKNENFNLIDLS